MRIIKTLSMAVMMIASFCASLSHVHAKEGLKPKKQRAAKHSPFKLPSKWKVSTYTDRKGQHEYKITSTDPSSHLKVIVSTKKAKKLNLDDALKRIEYVAHMDLDKVKEKNIEFTPFSGEQGQYLILHANTPSRAYHKNFGYGVLQKQLAQNDVQVLFTYESDADEYQEELNTLIKVIESSDFVKQSG